MPIIIAKFEHKKVSSYSTMTINSELLDDLTARAKENPRLRQSFDLRTTPEDQSQRMLNALEPGTVLPIHRHRDSSEVVVILRGRLRQNFYDDRGVLTESFTVAPGTDNIGYSVETGRWHNCESLESGTVILEAKNGAWTPLAPEDTIP